MPLRERLDISCFIKYLFFCSANKFKPPYFVVYGAYLNVLIDVYSIGICQIA